MPHTPRVLGTLGRNLPAILAFSLLLFQVAIPWTVPHFVTQDGPSHVYTAVVARDLLLDRTSPFQELYRFSDQLVPNWGHTVMLGIFTWISVDHAEQLMMSFLMLVGFVSFSYAFRSIAPEASPWTPLANFLTHTSFLWIGFINFCLSCLLFPVVVGYYIRHIGRLTFGRVATLAAWITGLFFIHLMGAALAMLTLFVLGVWNHFLHPFLLPVENRPRRIFSGSDIRQLGLLAAALTPTALLLVWFVVATGSQPFQMDFRSAWATFPMQVFTTGAGRAGGQVFLWPAVLCFIALGAAAMKRSEWRTPRGALMIVACLAFALTLVLPDAGLGGSGAKARFAWVVFIAGALAAWALRRFRPLRVPFAMYVAAFLAGNLTATMEGVRGSSPIVENYLAIANRIPRGASLVRIRFALAYAPELDIGRNLLVHTDAYIAAHCHCIDLSDYEVASATFPVVFRSSVLPEDRLHLWDFEVPSGTTGATLRSLQKTLPRPIDYVILVADETSGPDAVKLQEQLDSEMQLVASSPPVNPFVRLYARTGVR